MRRLVPLVLTAVLLSAAVSACGDDEERLSEEEFVEQANAICAEGNERIEEALESFPDDEEPDPDEVEQFFEDEFVPAIQEQIDSLDELNPPEDLQEDFDELLDVARSALDESADLSGEEILNQEDDPFAEVSERSADLGLDVCAE